MPEITVRDIAESLGLTVLAGAHRVDNRVTGGYACDLLSCVMAGARAGNAWVTLQAHLNVIAVASLLDLSCVIITEGATMDEAALSRANEKGIPVLGTRACTFDTVARLHEAGVRNDAS